MTQLSLARILARTVVYFAVGPGTAYFIEHTGVVLTLGLPASVAIDYTTPRDHAGTCNRMYRG